MNLNKIPPQIPVFGDINFRGPCPLETPEQISFLCLLKAEFPELAKIADIVIPCCPPMLIELKRRDHTKSSTSAKQLNYLVDSQEQGAFACYALGAVGAIEAVRAWHTINKA